MVFIILDLYRKLKSELNIVLFKSLLNSTDEHLWYFTGSHVREQRGTGRERYLSCEDWRNPALSQLLCRRWNPGAAQSLAFRLCTWLYKAFIRARSGLFLETLFSTSVPQRLCLDWQRRRRMSTATTYTISSASMTPIKSSSSMQSKEQVSRGNMVLLYLTLWWKRNSWIRQDFSFW